MEKNSGGPAFPGPYADKQGKIEVLWKQHGMTLRDYFAAKAMESLIVVYKDDRHIVAEYAERAYKIADAMLEARKE